MVSVFLQCLCGASGPRREAGAGKVKETEDRHCNGQVDEGNPDSEETGPETTLEAVWLDINNSTVDDLLGGLFSYDQLF